MQSCAGTAVVQLRAVDVRPSRRMCVGGILTIGYIRLGSFRAFTPHDPEIVLDEDRREIAEKLDDFLIV